MSPTSHVMATKEPMVIVDIVEDELVDPESRLMAQNQGFHGAALIPLLANDRSLGVLRSSTFPSGTPNRSITGCGANLRPRFRFGRRVTGCPKNQTS